MDTRTKAVLDSFMRQLAGANQTIAAQMGEIAVLSEKVAQLEKQNAHLLEASQRRDEGGDSGSGSQAGRVAGLAAV